MQKTDTVALMDGNVVEPQAQAWENSRGQCPLWKENMVTDEFEKDCKFTAYIILGLFLRSSSLLKYKWLIFRFQKDVYVFPF